ncbi:Menl-1, partial [Drosophila busckii]
MAFNMEERQRLNVNGLFPSAVRTIDEQIYSVTANFLSRPTNISRYRYMRSLRARQERLYFRFLSVCTKDVLPVIYTPTVGEACTVFSMIYRGPMGIYLTKYDHEHMTDVLKNWPETDIRVVCVTDGERILGLGDLGANGMGISVGKLDLYTALGRLPPKYLLPVVLDVGTNNKELLADPLYVGVREKRVRGQEYDDLVQEFMDAVVKCYGRRTLIHFEDFATPNAFRFIKKYQSKYCYFNDDIQGTAATGLAGFLNIERVTKKKLQEHVILFVGAGSAALGIGRLLLRELMNRKLSEEEACKQIYIVDANGLLTTDRTDIVDDIKPFAKKESPMKNLEEIVEKFKPSIILGATGQGGIFTEKLLQTMAKNHERPGIFACSNPTIKAECTAEQAYKATEGRALFASGSPFPPVVHNGKRITPGQANNCFAFPGIGMAVFCCRPRFIPDEIWIMAARTLADFVSDEDIASGRLYPLVQDATEVAFHISVVIAEYLYDNELATIHPRPDNICKFVTSHLYSPSYDSSLSPTWPYPEFERMP